MFRLEVNQTSGKFNLSWVNEKNEEEYISGKPAENKFEINQKSREQIVESGLIPTSAVFEQTEKATLRWKDEESTHMVTIERIGEKGEFSWPKEWKFRVTEDGVTETFRAPTPDAILAYEYYFNLVKKEILQRLKFTNF